jgi:hypothetical protein
MREIKVVSAHPKHGEPHIFVVFFSDGAVMEYNSNTMQWFTKMKCHKDMFV